MTVFFIDSSAGSFQSVMASGSYGKKSNLDVTGKRPFAMQKQPATSTYIGVKYHINYPQPQDLISLHNFKDGYCGISNIEEGKCCLCYLTTANNLRSNSNSIQTMEENVLQKNPHLKKIFSNAHFLYKVPLTISGISFAKKLQIENHLLMTGDAAGMITPLCGNGMSMAMHSARIAFELIHLFLSGKCSRLQMEEEYSRTWQKNFSTRLQVGRIVQKLFGGNISTALFLRSMKAMPTLARGLISLTHGKPF